MTVATNTEKRAGKAHRRREIQRHSQGLTAREQAALERICRWFSKLERTQIASQKELQNERKGSFG